MAALEPNNTVLFLGAGSSMPSGAPSGRELALALAEQFGVTLSSDLAEVASIIEYRFGRERLVQAVKDKLRGLKPSTGLRALPTIEWRALFTTNFDELIEHAYRALNKDCIIVRSNHDYGRATTQPGIELFKLHGCVSRDVSDGHTARMVLTEQDYELVDDYRQALQRRLAHDMVVHDTLIIGSSLGDAYLKTQLLEVARLHSQQQSPGQLYLLVYEAEDDRAALLEQKGIKVYSGALDEFIHVMAVRTADEQAPVEAPTSATSFIGLHSLASTVDVSHAVNLSPNTVKLFNGRPATYADVASGNTFTRSVEASLYERVLAEKAFLVLTGAGGTGKTSLARRLLVQANREGWHCWEHRSNFPFRLADWKSTEQALHQAGARGILFIDDCQEFLGSINKLTQYLADLGRPPALKVLMTLTYNNWRPRTKSSALLRYGHVEILSVLTADDIEALLNLIAQRRSIRELVDTQFSRLSRDEQRSRLRSRCKADMYVCLKNIFASEALDDILLREFAELPEPLQQIYRFVSAIEATGAQAHRQLLIRLTGIESGTISGIVQALDGVIDEYDINAREGIYGWSTRHQLVAQTIARYKFTDDKEREQLLRDLVGALNPTVFVEARALREICSKYYGIGSLANDETQIELLAAIIRLDPTSRVPRHRIIGKYLHLGYVGDAEREIRAAEEAIGLDGPLRGYKVRLLLRRSEVAEGLMQEDRRALVLQAARLAMEYMHAFVDDKYSFLNLADVAARLAHGFEDQSLLRPAYEALEEAEARLLDEMLSERRREIGALLRLQRR